MNIIGTAVLILQGFSLMTALAMVAAAGPVLMARMLRMNVLTCSSDECRCNELLSCPCAGMHIKPYDTQTVP